MDRRPGSDDMQAEYEQDRIDAARDLAEAEEPTIIRLAGIRLLSGSDLDAEVGEVGALGGTINDRAAATIASHWQGPGTPGKHLAALASGAPVDLDDLIDDIDGTIREVEHHPQWSVQTIHAERTNLDLLRAWAEEQMP